MPEHLLRPGQVAQRPMQVAFDEQDPDQRFVVRAGGGEEFAYLPGELEGARVVPGVPPAEGWNVVGWSLWAVPGACACAGAAGAGTAPEASARAVIVAASQRLA
ncbi:hypothetical protein ACGFYQ_29995 [Streptomyces sp. NPDC048258]|uniref:hypothetical protein n=1 Tax=Streptomyces sp. NPDC048258 TaxID=3365527 RepID=UPI0037139D86